MEKLRLIVLLFFALFIAGCLTTSDWPWGGVTPTCNDPYILVGASCCLDQNNNDICDDDETTCGNNNCERTENYTNCPSDCDSPGANIEYLKKGIVYIEATVETCCDSEGQPISYSSVGTGVIYPIHQVLDYPIPDDEWVAVTNRHVADCFYTGGCTFGTEQDLLITTYDGFEYTPSSISYAPDDVDIAFLVFEKNPLDSAHVVEVDLRHIANSGDEVYAIGNPSGGIPWTVTRGIVSNLGQDPSTNVDVIQTDSAINPGNSGGGLFDKTSGKLLGINTWKWVGVEGIGYAIDSNELERLANDAIYCEDSGDVLLTDSCYICDDGYILTSDGQCEMPCYFDDTEFAFFYCTEDSYCFEGSCYTDYDNPDLVCPDGYVLGQDEFCYPECGDSGSYCSEDAWCYNNECVVCPPDQYLGVDGYCYEY